MTTASRRPLITVLTPVFNEIDNLRRYEQVVREELWPSADFDFEVLFIDDGSSDGSWRMIEDICQRDQRFRGLRLSRNFGAHAALAAGIQHANSDAVAILACDLQDPPGVILEFGRCWQAGARIVWGKRRSRADSWWRTAASTLFEGLLRYALPAQSRFTTGSFLLMDRRVVECYRQFHETNRITFALVAWTGFEQAVVEYDRHARQAGQSRWKLPQLIRTACDAFLAFSRVPFGLVAVVGAVLFLLGLPLGLSLGLSLLSGEPQAGWLSILLALTTFFGLHFILMSIQGEYLARVHAEAVRRPLFFVSDETEVREDGSRIVA